MIANGLLMNGADTLSMSLYDYQAALWHWSRAHETEDEGEPPSVEELEAGFLRMARSGVARVH